MNTWPPPRRELLAWFHRNAESLAEPYEGAIRLLGDRAFPGRIHFIAHAVRDIANRLVDVLDPKSKRKRVQYECELDRIEKLWPGLQLVTDANVQAAPQQRIAIDFPVASMIDALVNAHRKKKQKPSNRQQLLRILMEKQPTKASLNQRLVSEFENLCKWFDSWAHLRAEKTAVDEDELLTKFAKFEGILHSFVGDFFTGIAGLDEILQQANEQAT